MGLSADMPEFKDRTIWEFLWKDQYGIEEQNNGKLARHFNDYFFTILPYGIVIVGLLVLISI